ncbi:hypothetical protein J7E93_21890 [Streptomyces sp. ISL-36]|uniref:hypothetical protein n=1 Tax=Streptomyces sp. ISL-36 TaxID=2819182 RepID=UPI001BEA0099|nr:hypothetical protein [Streptomyces sp. ISL-36]MBT2442711.1 hypothetical protein [Streptomyces sp. ISL-36]
MAPTPLVDDIWILDVWSTARTFPASRRRLLLSKVDPSLSLHELGRLSLGRCNQLVLRARQAVFGSRLDGETACPDCGERLDLEIEFQGLLDGPASDRGDTEPPAHSTESIGTVRVGGLEVRFRAPSVSDFERASESADPESAAQTLLSSCVIGARRLPAGPGPDDLAVDPSPGAGLSLDALPEEVVDALDTELHRHDPYGDLRVTTVCPACGHGFDVGLDPVTVFWEEIEGHARLLLFDVHRLASAYGWSEQDCLRLDPVRRACYLELIG